MVDGVNFVDGQVTSPLERGMTGKAPLGLCSSRNCGMAPKWRRLSTVVEQAEECKSAGVKPLEGFNMFGHQLRYRNAHGPQLPRGRRVKVMSCLIVESRLKDIPSPH